MVIDLDRLGDRLEQVPTAPIAAAGLIAGFAAAVTTGSRPLGGVVLAACGLTCIVVWLCRDSRSTTLWLTGAGLCAFALSHVLGRVIGSWPAVLLVAAATAGLCWRLSDSRRGWPATGRLRRPASAGSPRTPLRPDRTEPRV